MKELYAFDFDGTLAENCLRREGRRLVEIEGIDFCAPELLPGRREAIEALVAEGEQELGHPPAFAVITNQAGCAFGHRTQLDVGERLKVGIDKAFGDLPVRLYVCWAHPAATVPGYSIGHGRRKPSGAMIVEAMRDAGTKPVQTMYVGDLSTDELAAKDAGCSYLEAERFFRSWSRRAAVHG